MMSLNYLQDNFATCMPAFDQLMCLLNVRKGKHGGNMRFELSTLYHFRSFRQNLTEWRRSTDHFLTDAMSQCDLLRRRLNRREQNAAWLQHLPGALLGFSSQKIEHDIHIFHNIFKGSCGVINRLIH